MSVPDVSGLSEEVHRTMAALFEPSAVVELRAKKGRRTRSGYFNDHELLGASAAKLGREGWQLYVTLNEVNPALLARANNRVREEYESDTTTSDTDITQRRWLPLDFDPVRPADVSSTDEEKQQAFERAMECKEYLASRDWPEPIVGDSGNGYHLLYRVALPNDPASAELVRGVLEALAFRFDDPLVKLDRSVHNASRIWKLYGSVARKGDGTSERPHRASRVIEVPKEES